MLKTFWYLNYDSIIFCKFCQKVPKLYENYKFSSSVKTLDFFWKVWSNLLQSLRLIGSLNIRGHWSLWRTWSCVLSSERKFWLTTTCGRTMTVWWPLRPSKISKKVIQGSTVTDFVLIEHFTHYKTEDEKRKSLTCLTDILTKLWNADQATFYAFCVSVKHYSTMTVMRQIE